MNKALISAWITAEQFKEEWVIFAHWTWTQMWDTIESQSIHNVFWDWVTVTWVKWVLWHALWWSLGQSVAIWLSTFKNNIIPWTLNYSSDNRMEWIPDLDIVESNRNKEVKYIMINAFWFGWHNVSMIIENPKYS
jgi:3-oxoacyl-(acyl-carrier-protein) synthase